MAKSEKPVLYLFLLIISVGLIIWGFIIAWFPAFLVFVGWWISNIAESTK